MKDAFKRGSRVHKNASGLYDPTQELQCPTQNISEETVSRNISWIGPQQMATWRVTGYVADSEDEDQEIDSNFIHQKVSQHNQRSKNYDGEPTTFDEAPTLNDESLLEDFQSQSKQAGVSSPITVIETIDEKFLDEDTTDLDKHLLFDSHYGQKARTEYSTGSLAVESKNPDESSNTTVQRHEAFISQGQSVIRDVLSQPSGTAANHLDDLDSPLSTPPDSPTLLPLHTSSPREGRPASPVLTSTVHAASRSLRARKAIQIHPYMLDYAKHQKEWGERGLKPVHIPRITSPEHRTHEEESQDFASRDESQGSQNLAQESMELDEVNQTSQVTSIDPSEEDLPDLDTLLREDTSKPKHRLRQKTRLRQSNKSISKLPDTFEVPLDDESGPQSTKPTRQFHTSKQNSFPSPPRSRSSSLADHSLSATSEVRVSPKPLTPTASAGLRARRRRIVEDDSQSQTEFEKAFVAVSSSEDDVESSDTEVESEDVRIMQKRLRGVVPASYMTIARAQQDVDTKRRQAAKAAAKSAMGPGVAERKQNKTPRQSLEKSIFNWYEDLVSENEDSEADANQVIYTPKNTDNKVNESLDSDIPLHEDSEAMEAMEDDEIDRMLPPRHRTNKVRAKRQNTLQHINVPGSRKRKRHHREHAAGGLSNPRKRNRRCSSSNLIHVHDAPDLSPTTATKPSWLRVAARQARRIKAPGITASKKFFQLDSPEETAAVLSGVNQRKSDLTSRRTEALKEKPRHSSSRQIDGHASNPPKTPRGSAASRQPNQTRPLRLSVMDENISEMGPGGNIGSAQYDDNALLRLTRLRSLLPLKNRAGQGRFVHKTSEPRVAQLEEVQQSHSGLSRHILRRPSTTVRQPKCSIDQATRPISAPKDRTESEQLEQSSLCPTLPNEFARAPRKNRKQIPVYRPILHQTLLVPIAQNTTSLQALIGQTDTNVRMVLEQEFVTHQAEWFQGRKDGIICANGATQRHFRVFLEVLGSYLSAMLENSNETQDMRGLRSFLYRLVPNRGSIGAQGQVGDKTMEVREFDIMVAKNVFDLHVCLLNLAPAYAPLPRVLETKVSFVDAHNEICLIALSAWQAICDHHHTQHFIAEGLSGWLYLILTQLVQRWKSAESDARTEAEAERSIRRVDEQIIRKVIEHNRAQASGLITAALESLLHGIEYATGIGEATSLLDLNRYTEITSALVKLPIMDSEVFRTMLKVASSYTKQWLSQSSSNIHPLLSCLRQITTALTSYEAAPSSELQFSMIQAFFSTAQVAVVHRQKSWDDFFVRTSSFSPDMFVSSKYQDTSKALFYHFLIENDQNAYLIDFRGAVLSQWLRILLQVRDDEPSALLTYSIFKSEKDSLEISSLAASFHPPGSTFTVSAIRALLPEIRHATVMHVIAHLSGQENNAEAEWLPGGLDESDAVRLLRTIFTTLKETWVSLSERPVEQDAYTVLVHLALDQYEIHSRADFTVEPWFSNSAMFPQRRKRSLAQLFTKRVVSDTEFVREATDVMQQELAHAKRFDRMDNLEEELKEFLLPRTVDPINSLQNQNHLNIVSRHMLFIQDVLPPLIKPTTSTPNDASSMLLNVLIHITSTIECRTSTHNGITTKHFTTALIAIVTTVANQLSILNADNKAKVYTLTLLAFELSIAAGDALSDRFMDDIGRICDFAMQGESREGMALLAGVVGRI